MYSIYHRLGRFKFKGIVMQVTKVRCFGGAPGVGNIALVIENGPAGAEQRQAFARDSGHGACVFLTPLQENPDRWEADYVYPHARSPLCLHASLAAAHVLLGRGGGTQVTLITAMRGQQVVLTREADAVFAIVQKHAVAPIGIEPGLAAHLLGEPDLQLASPPLLSSIGSPKLLIEVVSPAVLHALRPPLDRIVDWGKENGVNGCYVYCVVGKDVYEGRNFNHVDPAKEDTATGVAAGALGAWLGRGVVMLQGAALGNPCRIVTQVRGNEIYVGGATEALA